MMRPEIKHGEFLVQRADFNNSTHVQLVTENIDVRGQLIETGYGARMVREDGTGTPWTFHDTSQEARDHLKIEYGSQAENEDVEEITAGSPSGSMFCDTGHETGSAPPSISAEEAQRLSSHSVDTIDSMTDDFMRRIGVAETIQTEQLQAAEVQQTIHVTATAGAVESDVVVTEEVLKFDPSVGATEPIDTIDSLTDDFLHKIAPKPKQLVTRDSNGATYDVSNVDDNVVVSSGKARAILDQWRRDKADYLRKVELVRDYIADLERRLQKCEESQAEAQRLHNDTKYQYLKGFHTGNIGATGVTRAYIKADIAFFGSLID